MAFCLILKPTNHAVQFIKFRCVFGHCFGIVLCKIVQLDQQKKNVALRQLYFLWPLEPAFGDIALDFHDGRLGGG